MKLPALFLAARRPAIAAAPPRALEPVARAVLPTGAVVPDLARKHSLVLEQWTQQQRAARAEAQGRRRLATAARSYESAGVDRLTSDWSALNTSADSELITSLRQLRARSRQLVRDNPYAKHAVRVICANVVGTGIGMQAQVKSAGGNLQTAVNDDIERVWAEWGDKATCHTAGELAWADIERIAMAQIVTAGEVLLRLVRAPFGGGQIPLAVEVIEADRLMDQWQSARAPNGNAIRMGKEVDEWGRAVAYWLWPRHPGDYQFATFVPSKFMRVPAEDMIHLYLVDRWPQTRGEPWFHAVLRDLHQQHGYEEAEVVKARASANVVGFIRAPEPLAADAKDADGRHIIDTEPGTWQRLLPGEDVAGLNPSAPNPGLEPFLRYMVRKMAVGVGISYGSLSRDRSQANYSSERIDQLEDRDLYRMIQGWLVRNLRTRVHREFIAAAMVVGAIKRIGADYWTNPGKYQAVRFRPRGWSWIDPAKEVNAYKTAVRCGFMSPEDVIAQTGGGADIEDVYRTWAENRDLAEELELVFDIDPAMLNDKGASQPSMPAATEAAEAPGHDQADDAFAPAAAGASESAPDDDESPAA